MMTNNIVKVYKFGKKSHEIFYCSTVTELRDGTFIVNNEYSGKQYKYNASEYHYIEFARP